MSKQDWRTTEIQRLRLYQPLELNLLRRTFPCLDDLLQQLWDLLEATDPRMSRPIDASGKGGGEQDGTETVGSEEGGFAKVTMRGGLATEAAWNRVHEVNHDLRRLARRIFDGMDRPARRTVRLFSRTRQCRQETCPDKNRRQWGMMRDGAYWCRTCGRKLGDAL